MKKNLKKTDTGSVSKLLWDFTVRATKKITDIIPPRIKTLAATGALMLFSHGNAATPFAAGADKDAAENTAELSKKSKAGTEASTYDAAPDFKSEAAKINLKTSGTYNGFKLDFSELEAPDLGHVFESGLNPYIVGSGGQYLGLYQMDTGATMGHFLFGLKEKGKVIFPGVAKDYPKLAALGRDEKGRRSKAFVKMFGDLSKEKDFRHKMDTYMRVAKYEPVYEALRNIPELDFDTRGETFRATVMSATNQNSIPKVIAKIYSDALKQAQATAANQKRDVTTADIIKASYEIRTKRWGLAGRYKEECRLALDWLKFEEKRQQIKLQAKIKQEKYNNRLKTIRPVMPFQPVSNLETKQKIEVPQWPLSPEIQKKIVHRKQNSR